jgi:hypothetical protein
LLELLDPLLLLELPWSRDESLDELPIPPLRALSSERRLDEPLMSSGLFWLSAMFIPPLQ